MFFEISFWSHDNQIFGADAESCSSPLFMPLGMKRSVQKTRKPPKDGGVLSTDSEDLNGSVKEKRQRKRHKGRQRSDDKDSEEVSKTQKEANKFQVDTTKQQLQTSATKHMDGKDSFVAENKTNVPGECESFPAKSFTVNHQAVGYFTNGTNRTVVFLKIHCRKEKL